MKTSHFLLAKAMFALVVVVGVSGCGKVTGGGWIQSTSGEPGDKANFGFNAGKCFINGQSIVTGRFNYHDQNAVGFAAAGGVKMNGSVMEAGLCGAGTVIEALCSAVLCPAGSYVMSVDYGSTNPDLPGDGLASACVTDNGEGINATSADMGKVVVSTGPYAGYVNSGPVQGNIRAHECENN